VTTEDSENNRNNRLKPKRKKLLFLLGLGLLGGAGFLGLQMIRGQSFRTILFFPSARGITRGMPVTYWGVKVGEVMGFEPEPKGVAVEIKIWPADRLIPRDSLFKLSRVEGENSLDIQPRSPLPAGVDKMTPKSPNCDSKIILCNTKRISSISRLYWGNLVYSLNSIQDINSGVQSMETNVGDVSSDVREMKGTVQELGQLGQEVQGLLKMDKINKTLNKLDKTLTSVEQAANSISLAAQKAGKLSDQGTGLLETVRQTQTIDRLNTTLGSVGSAADQVQVFMKLNQNNLKNTLISIEQLSKQVTLTVRKLDPLSEQIQAKNLLENLEIISRNAAQLTTNLNEVSTQLKDPRSHLQIQQIMDSAQSLLNNLNKITSDVDELTGNPSLRRDILRLIQGLTNLLSSTQLLQQQVAYDKVLNQVAMESDRPKPLQP
jgi:phospholipid/cholesterol/gamma-HCH transport system substrate-binding protein